MEIKGSYSMSKIYFERKKLLFKNLHSKISKWVNFPFEHKRAGDLTEIKNFKMKSSIQQLLSYISYFSYYGNLKALVNKILNSLLNMHILVVKQLKIALSLRTAKSKRKQIYHVITCSPIMFGFTGRQGK